MCCCVLLECDGGICVTLVSGEEFFAESVTTSVGDLHKAPFQSCSARRTGGESRREREVKTDTNTDGPADRLAGKKERQ